MSKQDLDSSNKSISLADGIKIVPGVPTHTLDDEEAPSSNPYYIPQLSWTDKEESKIIRTLDTRLFPWILLTTFVLNMDRTNHSNAVSDNLVVDLGFTNDTVNLGIAVYSVIFSFACLSGAVISKIVGPARWIPVLMFAWGLVTMAHALITNRGGYLTVRCMIALTEGGVIPATLIYLGSFYKSTELATCLVWFWGIICRFYLLRNITQTAGSLRGWKPWFDERQLQIGVMQKVKWSDVKDAATDVASSGSLTESENVDCTAPLVIFRSHRSCNLAFYTPIEYRMDVRKYGVLHVLWSVGKRTIASGCIIFAANIYGGLRYTRAMMHQGNTINICFAGVAVILWFVQKYYYYYRNTQNLGGGIAHRDSERKPIHKLPNNLVMTGAGYSGGSQQFRTR
ncbi:MFS general substrate transporter [Armillaria solidipes]|uniref:MFS general substrate transporter n=1 Tax=Armillaria solidipes TaxID=1076256 RepID=A0A2H3BFL4_9AGAR|nr:MFS general substrate transporter [Armillaria solidipes]